LGSSALFVSFSEGFLIGSICLGASCRPLRYMVFATKITTPNTHSRQECGNESIDTPKHTSIKLIVGGGIRK
jgi:hypothetical protein